MRYPPVRRRASGSGIRKSVFHGRISETVCLRVCSTWKRSVTTMR
jgi:hypothetical protein